MRRGITDCLGLRQQNTKIGIAFPITFYTDLPFVVFYNRFRDGKPQSVAAGLPASGTVNPVKTFKNTFLVFYINTFSGIMDKKLFFFLQTG